MYLLVSSDKKTEQEHVEHGIKTGSVSDIQYVSGGVRDVIDSTSYDNSYYKVFIINELSDREEVWGASGKDTKSLYIGKELKLDTTKLWYLETTRKPQYTKQ